MRPTFQYYLFALWNSGFAAYFSLLLLIRALRRPEQPPDTLLTLATLLHFLCAVLSVLVHGSYVTPTEGALTLAVAITAATLALARRAP